MQQLSAMVFRKKLPVQIKTCAKTMKIVKNCKLFVLTGAAALLTGCGPSNDELFAEVGKALEASLAKDFAGLEFEEHSSARGMQPTVTFTGKTSTILVQEKPERRIHTFINDEVNLSGLAITKNGRYFTFTYQAPLFARSSISFFPRACVDADCRYFAYHQSVSRQAAMEWFFNSEAFTPERFKELFNEDAPAKKVEA